jgi:hypothetical protein
MAVVRENSQHNAFGSGSSSTPSFTTSGNDRILFVITGDVAVNTYTITYNGVALTQIQSEVVGSKQMQLWYLINPASGAHTLSMSRTDSGAWSYIAVQYSGAQQASPIDTSNSVTGQTGATITGSVTATKDDWVLLAVQSANTQSASTNATQVVTESQGIGAYDNQSFGTVPPGSFSMTVTQTSGTYGYIIAAFKSNSVSITTSDTIGASVEAVSLTTATNITVSEVAGTPQETVRVSKGFQNQTKNSSTWTNQQKS